MRLSGLISGMDTESIIQQLVSAKQTKVDDAKKAQTKLEWKTTAWKDLNTKLKNLQSKYVNNMRFTSAYMKKTTSVSDSTAASIITGENAMNGVQNLKITQLAKTAYMTGGKTSLRTKTDADGDDFKLNALTKLSDLSVDNKGTALDLSTGTKLNIKSGDTNVELEITADTTISDVLTKLKEAGLNANGFDRNTWVASGKQGLFEEDNFNSPGYVLRVDYRGVPGLRVGGSFYYCANTAGNSDKPNFYEGQKASLRIYSGDLQYKNDYVTARANVVYGNLTNSKFISSKNVRLSNNASYSRVVPVAKNAVSYAGEVPFSITIPKFL